MRLPLPDFWIAGLDDDRRCVRSHALSVISRQSNPPRGALARVMARIDADGWDEAFQFSHLIDKFPHDATSMDWVTERLMRTMEPAAENPDPGLRFLLPWFCEAPVGLLETRIDQVSKAYETYLAAQGGALKFAFASGPVDTCMDMARERIAFASATLDNLEQQLGETIADCSVCADFPPHLVGRLDSICEALGKRNGIPAETLAAWLEVDPEEEPDDYDTAQDWYAGAAVEILRHGDAPVPLESLINWLIIDWDWMNDRVSRTLGERADETLMTKLLEMYPAQEWSSRLFLHDVIKCARFASCEAAVRQLTASEKASDLQSFLAETLVLYGSPESVDAARAVQRRNLGREQGELTEKLLIHDWLTGDQSRRNVMKLDELERRARRFLAKMDALEKHMSAPKDDGPVRSYVDSAIPEPPAAKPAVGRNEPCPCGSGKKFKKCCAK